MSPFWMLLLIVLGFAAMDAIAGIRAKAKIRASRRRVRNIARMYEDR